MAQDELTSGVSVDRVASAPEGDVDIVSDRSLPEILLNHVEKHGDDIALRWKRFGIWQEFTWTAYYDRVRWFALGLEEYGFAEGDVLFTIGYNRPHQLWAWLGAQSLGGMAAPNYQDMLPEEIGKQLDLLRPRIVFAEDQEMVDKVLSVADDAPDLETIIYRDERGMFRYEQDDPQIVSYAEVEARGRERVESGAVADDYIAARIRKVDPNTPAMLSPTSGTTGTPKRVQLSHFNFVNLANAAIEIDPLPKESDYFSYLPMAWVGEQMILIAAAFVGGWTANFPEQEETEREDLREIGPEIIFSSPRTYEAWVADIKAKIENTTRLKRWAYEKAMAIGQEYTEYVTGEKAGQTPPATLRAKNWLAYWLAYRPILDKIGLKRAKNVYTGGGPLGEEHFEYYHALGVRLKQIWGQSEVCGFVTMHRDGDIQADTVGQVFPNVEVGLTPGGELVVRGPVVTSGYYNQPEKTASAIEDGWLHTDDFGDITEDGHVKVFDRMDDVLELADGTAIAPISVETKLKFNPYIKEAMVVGDERDYLAAVLNIRYDNVAEWADQRDIQYTGYRDLTQKPQVLDLITGVVEETNARLEGNEIRKFIVLFKEFDPDDGELTRTGKIRRKVVGERYASLVEDIYSDKEECEIDITITYQDGRETREHGDMAIIDVVGARLEASPYVANAALVGEGREYLGAMVTIDGESVGEWAEDQGISYTDADDLAQKSEVRNLITERVRDTNETLKNTEIRKFVVISETATADDSEHHEALKRDIYSETSHHGRWEIIELEPVEEATPAGGAE